MALTNGQHSNRFRFTIERLQKIPAATPGKRLRYYDTEAKGLILRVTENGVKSFHFEKKVNGRKVTIFLGQFPQLKIDQAREKVVLNYSHFLTGQDPRDEKRRAREELTLGELFDQYIKYAEEHCTTWEEIEKSFDRWFGDWKQRRLSTIEKLDVQNRINYLGKDKHKHRANRAHDDLKAVFNWGINNNLFPGPNPCIGITRFKVQSRERFIQPDEFERFYQAVLVEDADIRDFVLLCLYTGARKSNVMEMRWEFVSQENSTWFIPRTKNGDSQTITLIQSAACIK